MEVDGTRQRARQWKTWCDVRQDMKSFGLYGTERMHRFRANGEEKIRVQSAN